MNRSAQAALFACIILIATGCAGLKKPDVTKSKEAVRLPTRVAVLPFYLDVKPPVDPLQERATDILREQFFNHFASLSYLDLDLAEVDRRLAAAGISADQAALATDPQRLATVLGVDGLIVGRVTDVSIFKGGVITDSRLGGSVKLISSVGTTVWEADHTESRQGGVLLRGSELISALEDLSGQMKDQKHLTYLKLAEEYSRKVVATAPEPDMSKSIAFAAPKIRKVTVQVATGRVLQLGDQVRAEVESDPGLSGTLDLGLWRRGTPLVEVSSGRYVGVYTVQAGDAAQSVPVTVRLSDAFGLSTSSDVQGLTLTVDASPPPSPEGVSAQATAGQGVVVSWQGSSEASGFSVYRSCPPEGGLIQMATVTGGGMSYSDPSGANSCTYQVGAFDAHENLSYPTVAVWR